MNSENTDFGNCLSSMSVAMRDNGTGFIFGDRLAAADGLAGDSSVGGNARIGTGLLGTIFFRFGLGERVCCGEMGAVNAGMVGVAAAAVNESGPGMPGTNGINLPPWKIS